MWVFQNYKIKNVYNLMWVYQNYKIKRMSFNLMRLYQNYKIKKSQHECDDCKFSSPHMMFPTITPRNSMLILLTHWGLVTHKCVGKPTIIGSDNGLSPDRHQAIIWTNDGILLIAPLGTNFSEISTGIQTFSFKKMHLKMVSVKWRQFCLSLNVLI